MKDYLYRLAADYLLDADVKANRERLRHRIILFFCIACLVALVVLATRAHAQDIPVHVVEHPQVKMRLLASRCTDPQSHLIIATAPPQFQEGWRAIASVWLTKEGTWQEYAGCWLEVPREVAGTPENLMLLVFADGAVVQVLKSELLKKPGMPGV